MMTQYIQVEREPGCSLFDVPLIAAGTVADSLCCQGPRRDFATEMDFRLNNAAKMYPGSYALVSPYGYDYRMQYGRSSPRYAHHVAPPPIQEVPPVYRQKQPVEPLYLPPYPVQASPQLSARAYRYDREAYINTTPEIVPPIPLRIERPFHEHAKYSWGASVRSHPIEPVGPQAHILLTTSSTQPGNTPRDGFFTPSWPRTVEVVKIEEQKREVGPVEEDLEKAEAGISSSKPTQEVVKQQPAKEAPVTPRSASSKRRAAAEKGPRPSKQNQPPERAEKGKEEPTVAPSKQPPSEQEVPPESEPQPETTEYAQQEESAVAKELKARDVAAVGGQKEPEASQESSSEEEDVKEREAKRDDEHEENDGTPDSDLPSSDEPVVAEETEGQGFRKDMDESLAMKSTGEDVKQNLPIFSVAISASTFAGPEVVTPRPVKVAGGSFPPGYQGAGYGTGSSSAWPVGYVPPADDKYTELVVGSQVFLEGGTFYLTETGAYLLGLCD